MYCHVGVQITGKTGASTEESHEHHVGGDTAGNGSDSGSASRESPPPPPNPPSPPVVREAPPPPAVMSRYSHKHAPGRSLRMRFQARPLTSGGRSARYDNFLGPLGLPRSGEDDLDLDREHSLPLRAQQEQPSRPQGPSSAQKGRLLLPDQVPPGHPTLLTCPAGGEHRPSQGELFAFRRVKCIQI